jgi:hypothetical protein
VGEQEGDLGLEFLRRDRLHDVAVDAGLLGGDDRIEIGAAGQHEERELGLGGVDLLEEIHARHPRHVPVAHDDVDALGVGQPLERLRSAFRLVDLADLHALQHAADQGAHGLVIVDDENTHTVKSRRSVHDTFSG